MFIVRQLATAQGCPQYGMFVVNTGTNWYTCYKCSYDLCYQCVQRFIPPLFLLTTNPCAPGDRREWLRFATCAGRGFRSPPGDEAVTGENAPGETPVD